MFESLSQGTGSALRVEPSDPTIKLAAVDEEKVSNIVEVCNVSRDEAVRVLDACHMDETMAIERFLSGNEVSKWSQVSKKKKPTQHPRSGSHSRSNYAGPSYNRNHDRDRDRDRDRRDRDRSSNYHSDHSHSNGYRRGPRQHSHFQHGYSQKSKDFSSFASKKQTPQSEKSTFEPAPQRIEPQMQTRSTPPMEETWADTKPNGIESWDDVPSAEKWSDPSKSTPLTDSTDNAWTGTTPSSEAAWADSSQPADGARGSESNASGPSQSAWGVQAPSAEVIKPQPETQSVEQDHSPISSPSIPEAALKQPVISSSVVKRNINYAAAAATGTSHAKPVPVAPEIQTSTPIVSSPGPSPVSEENESLIPESPESAAAQEALDPQKRRIRGNCKTRIRQETERQPHETDEDISAQTGNGLVNDVFDSQSETVAVATSEARIESPAASNAWVARPQTANPVEEKRLEDTATAVAMASAAVVGSDQSVGDSLSLQFGSFGLSGLDSVNWSASEQTQSEPAPSIVASEPTNVPTASSVTAPASTPEAVSTSATVQVSISPTPLSASNGLGGGGANQVLAETGVQSSVSNTLPASSASATGSGVFPMLPVGHGGNFPPPNYGAPYLMPPLPGYSPALGSYENAGDLGSSRGASLAPPGSLPLYDPAALSSMASGTAKYGGIPGLGDMSGLPPMPSGIAKDGLHTNPDIEKASALGTSGLPASMDPLAAQYMMPGYASIQYPMYTFPNAAYGHGMPPPGPSPFPYAPGGQVSSQGRGTFGFDDGTVGLGGNSRGGSSLGESMYTPGGYLNASMGHSGSQKSTNDGGYKQVRGNSHPGNSLGGMGMAGGIVHGMTYGDYNGGMSGVGNGVGSTTGPGSWSNNRQSGGGRADGSNVPGVVSNQSMPGGSQSSALYATAPGGGAPGAYWTHQQGGYYS